MRTLMLAAALVLATGTLDAQSAARPNTRQGFWIGFGLGPGSTGEDCSSCSNDRINGAAGYLRMGGTVSPHILLGGEADFWGTSYRGVDRTFGSGSFILVWYPSRTGAFYLKFGIGGMTYTTDNGTNELEATAGTGSFGLGYEFRVGRNFSVSPYLSSVASAPVEFKINGQPVAAGEDITMNLFQIGVGLTWH